MRSALSGLGFQPLTNSRPRSGGDLPQTEHVISGHAVRCTAEQVVIVSGIQQALDLLARFLSKKGDRSWIGDPGYFGARIAFENAGA